MGLLGRISGAILVALGAVALVDAPASAAGTPIEIVVLSNRADLVSGGDALVELRLGTTSLLPNVELNGRDISSVFALRPNGKVQGLVTGLKNGANALSARLPDGRGARLTITNAPIGGPAFSGRQIQPWSCAEGAADKQCNRPTRFELSYRPKAGSGLEPYDAANPPTDVATTTTDTGQTVPFIVRHEIGVLDRDEYRIASLYDPTKGTAPWRPPPGVNSKLIINHGASCDTGYEQDAAPGVLNETMLARGFIVMSHALDNAGHNCNIITQAESLVMTKERVVEQFGPVRYTIGTGCSGGSLVQQQVANAYPGLYQGITPACSFTDAWSSAQQYVDYQLLRAYFEHPNKWAAGVAWTPVQWASAYGHPNVANPITFTSVIASAGDPSRSCPGLPPEQVYDAQTNPRGVRCSLQDYMVNVFGRTPDGKARRPADNIGIQYGLSGVKAGTMLPSQFVDLNVKIGSFDIDYNPLPTRMAADPLALQRVYTSGAVNSGNNLDQVAIIDLRGPDPGAFHDVYRTYVMRARLQREHGTVANQLLWRGPIALLGDATFANEAMLAVDRWLTAVEKDSRAIPLARKLIEDKPADVTDRCTDGAGQDVAAAACDAVVQAYSSPRIEAGAPLTDDVLKCQLKPIRAEDYPPTFTAADLAVLRTVFPTGVCDYSKPGVSQRGATGWMAYNVDGGRPLGAPPASVPFTAQVAGEVIAVTGRDQRAATILAALFVAGILFVRRRQSV